MSISSLCEFLENCVYRHGRFNCFIKYLHRKLLTQLIIPEAVNKLVYQPAWTILVKLGEINIIILSKTQSFITG
jgi:hypothetical protein